MKFTRELLGRKNQKGVALLLTMFMTMMITYLVMEIIYDSSVEYSVNSQAVSRLKAYYAAKSGLEISLVRIKLYGQIQKQLGSQIPADKRKLLDMIWQFPFSWPPMIPEEASGVDKDLVQDKVKESTMDSSYVTSISEEGSKIDLNDLVSPSKGLREITKKLLLQTFEGLRQNDENWARANEDLRAEEIVNNIIDWVDADQISLNGGDERQNYAHLPADKPLPPNRGFRTIDELRMVHGVDEVVYNALKDRVTIYGMRAINPNHAPADVLKALDPSINDEIVTKIMARRNDPEQKPFENENEFWEYVTSEGARINPENRQGIPMIFTEVQNFRIKSTGQFANSTREIEAVVFDFNSVASTIAARLGKEAQGDAAGGAGNQSGTGGTATGSGNQGGKQQKSNEPLPKGPPRIVYLIER